MASVCECVVRWLLVYFFSSCSGPYCPSWRPKSLMIANPSLTHLLHTPIFHVCSSRFPLKETIICMFLSTI
ncbi:hypothetical protein EDB19DRAFT_1704522 [Suillus lakei]|nr:hypothetical protein EDB19DRAFT_1704522 [Suillus lakei]